MDVVTKATASVTPVEDSKSKHGEFDVILSTNALDRDGDELHADEWKTPLPDKITFDSDHGMSVATCVGSGKPFINDQGQLQVRGTFASTPHGQAVRTLVNEGHIDSVSVAFMDRKAQKSGKPLRELLNGAFVAVPANPQARVLSSKTAKKIEGAEKTLQDIIRERVMQPISDEDKALLMGTQKDAANYKLDETAAIDDMFQNDPLDGGDQTKRTEYWQGVHDTAVKLGAGCPYSDPQAQPDVLQSSNRSIDEASIIAKVLEAIEISLGVKAPESLSQKSTDESTAAAEATAADDSADDVALLGKSLAIRLGLIEP